MLLTVVLTLAVAFVGLAVLAAWLQSTPLIDDDMHGGSGPFVAESDPLVDLRYEDNGYVMDLTPMPDGNLQYARSFWQWTRPEIDFSISYELTDAPSTGDQYGLGIGCVGAGGTYWFGLAADGSALISLQSAEPTVLAQAEVPLPATARLRIVCEDGAGDGPTLITGFVDGEQAIEAEHPNGFGSFTAVGVFAAIGVEEPYVVAWDHAFAD